MEENSLIGYEKTNKKNSSVSSLSPSLPLSRSYFPISFFIFWRSKKYCLKTKKNKNRKSFKEVFRKFFFPLRKKEAEEIMQVTGYENDTKTRKLRVFTEHKQIILEVIFFMFVCWKFSAWILNTKFREEMFFFEVFTRDVKWFEREMKKRKKERKRENPLSSPVK